MSERENSNFPFVPKISELSFMHLIGIAPKWLSVFFFWLFGLLALSTAFCFGLFINVQSEMMTVLGFAFIIEQTAFAGLFFGGTLVFARLLIGLVFAFEWIPKISSRMHRKLQNIAFVLLFILMAFSFGSFVVDMDIWLSSTTWRNLGGIFLVPMVLGLLAAIRASNVRIIFSDQGTFVVLTSILIWASLTLGQSRSEFLLFRNLGTVCLVDGVAVNGSIVYSGSEFLVLVANDRWHGIHKERVLYLRSYDTDPNCSFPAPALNDEEDGG